MHSDRTHFELFQTRFWVLVRSRYGFLRKKNRFRTCGIAIDEQNTVVIAAQEPLVCRATHTKGGTYVSLARQLSFSLAVSNISTSAQHHHAYTATLPNRNYASEPLPRLALTTRSGNLGLYFGNGGSELRLEYVTSLYPIHYQSLPSSSLARKRNEGPASKSDIYRNSADGSR
jgi:hypothetical protein